MAPGAKLINLRVLDRFGSGTDFGVISAIDRAIELKIPYNIRVINLSLGRNIYELLKIPCVRPSNAPGRRESL